MTQNVVYFLGAGFSAPLGVPVTATFLSSALDMFAASPLEYAHFRQVFDDIRALAVAKNYFFSDQHNIEEILSILEMQAHVGGSDKTPEFSRLIKDVVEYHTPEMRHHPPPWPVPGAAPVHNPWGIDEHWHPYAYFVLGLFNRVIRKVPEGSLLTLPHWDKASVRYSVVSLNYDLLLETVCRFTEAHPYEGKCALQFAAPPDLAAEITKPLLAKIHGSVGGGPIVPPTWQKGKHSDVIPAWSAAFRALQTANEIRFIGYSLPETDSYVRYLFKAAAASSPNLKQVDVLCLDPSKAVEGRYKGFVDFANLRFVRDSTQAYLGELAYYIRDGTGLEAGHDVFFDRKRA